MLGRSSRNFARMSRVMPRQMGALGMIQFNSSPFHSPPSFFNQVYGHTTPSLMTPARFGWIQRRAFAKASPTEFDSVKGKRKGKDILSDYEKDGLTKAQIGALRDAKGTVLAKLAQADELAEDLQDKWDIHMSTAQTTFKKSGGKARSKARDLLAAENAEEIETYLTAVNQLTAAVQQLARVERGKVAEGLYGITHHFLSKGPTWRKRLTESVFANLWKACANMYALQMEIVHRAQA